MNPRLKYFIQCDEVRSDGGKLAAIGIFDSIYALIYPAAHKRFFIMMGFVGGEGDHELQVNLAAPNNATIAEVKGKIRFTSDVHVVNTVFAIENLPLPTEGRYTISVFLDGDFFNEQYFLVQAPNSGVQRTPEQIAELMTREDIVKNANVEVGCDRCRSVYRFQHNLDPKATPEPGFVTLPPGEFFTCGSCGNKIPIAQLRRNLENIVGIPRQWVQPQPQEDASGQDPGAPPAPAQ